MKAKLIKEKDWYDLYRIDEDGKRVTFASTQDYKQKLSLKNCQAIERGYDLDELTENFYERTGYHDFDSHSYKLGFQKALEILGDKKFNLGQLITAMDMTRVMIDGKYAHSGEEIFQSLQQNEWEVEVEMEPVFDIEYSNNGYRTEKFNKTEYKPKLDTDGCLILKRV